MYLFPYLDGVVASNLSKLLPCGQFAKARCIKCSAFIQRDSVLCRDCYGKWRDARKPKP